MLNMTGLEYVSVDIHSPDTFFSDTYGSFSFVMESLGSEPLNTTHLMVHRPVYTVSRIMEIRINNPPKYRCISEDEKDEQNLGWFKI